MNTEKDLRELFQARADEGPGTERLLNGALHKVRVRRQRLGAGIAGVAAVALLGVGVATNSPYLPSSNGPTATANGAAPQTSCAYAYSPENVAAKTEFAFDGTVTKIGDPVSERTGKFGYVGVSFAVHEWFKGGTGQSVTVDMVPPGVITSESHGSPTKYEIGTRLLVSGAAAWGGADPMVNPVAWHGCGGFTRTYSNADADAWRAAVEKK